MIDSITLCKCGYWTDEQNNYAIKPCGCAKRKMTIYAYNLPFDVYVCRNYFAELYQRYGNVAEVYYNIAKECVDWVKKLPWWKHPCPLVDGIVSTKIKLHNDDSSCKNFYSFAYLHPVPRGTFLDGCEFYVRLVNNYYYAYNILDLYKLILSKDNVDSYKEYFRDKNLLNGISDYILSYADSHKYKFKTKTKQKLLWDLRNIFRGRIEECRLNAINIMVELLQQIK